MSRDFPALSSHSFSDCSHHHRGVTPMTANMRFSEMRRALSVHREPPGCPTAQFRCR
jgi:hypothetical protein